MDRKSGIKYIILPFIITTLVTSGIIYGIMTSEETPNNILRNQKKILMIATPFEFPEENSFFMGFTGIYSWRETISAGLYRMVNSIDSDYEPDLALYHPLLDFDMKTITVKLKPDLRFSDGEPLTSLDVFFSYQLALNSEVGIEDHDLYDYHLSINNIQIVDNSTIIFILNQPYGFYMDLFTLPIVSRNILIEGYNENHYNWNNYTDFILAGPYNYNSSNVESISLVKNPNYWDADNIVLEEIIFKYFTSLDQVINSIQNNTIDIISPLFMITGDNINNKTDLVFNNIPDTSHNELSLNHKSPYWGTGALLPGNELVDETEKLADALKIRRAFSHTIDRSFAMFDVLNGRGIRAVTPISPSTFGYQTTIEPDTYSIDLAKSLFEEVGYDYSDLGEPDVEGNYHNFFFNLTLMSPNTGPSGSGWILQFERDLPKIGVGVNQHYSTGWYEIIPRTFGSQVPPPLFDEGGFDTLYISLRWGKNFNPLGLYASDALIPNGDNFYNFQNSSLDDIINDYLSEYDYQVRVNKLETLKKSLYDNLPVIPIVHNSFIWIWREEITGIDPFLINFGMVDWTKVSSTEYVAFGDSISDYLWFLIAPLIGAIITWIFFKRKYKVFEILDSVDTYPELPE